MFTATATPTPVSVLAVEPLALSLVSVRFTDLTAIAPPMLMTVPFMTRATAELDSTFTATAAAPPMEPSLVCAFWRSFVRLPTEVSFILDEPTFFARSFAPLIALSACLSPSPSESDPDPEEEEAFVAPCEFALETALRILLPFALTFILFALMLLFVFAWVVSLITVTRTVPAAPVVELPVVPAGFESASALISLDISLFAS